jgi:hypothetical protein
MMRRLSGACLAALFLVPFAAAKPPDLPNNPRITVAQPADGGIYEPADPQLPVPLESTNPEDGGLWTRYDFRGDADAHRLTALLNEVASTLHLLGVHPLIAWEGSFAAPEQPVPSEITWGAPEAPEPPSICPYLQQQADRPIRSINDEALADQVHKDIEEAIKQPSFKQAAEEQEPAAGSCPCCSWVSQFGMCWMSRVLAWCGGCCAEKAVDEQKCCCHAGGAQEEAEAHHCDTVCGHLERKLLQPLAADWRNEPLAKVLDDIRDAFSLPIVVDEESLKKAGIASPDHIPVTFQGEGMPLRTALELMLKPHGLGAEVKGCAVHISAIPATRQGGKEEASEEPAGLACGSACPKCEALHARRAGVEEQVTGLMKACYLAMEEGRIDKAADLAREAHALDPARVEGDPLVYKMHLLAQKCAGACHGASCPRNPCRPADKNLDPATCDAPDQPVRPDLPAVDEKTVPALDDVLTGKDEASKAEEPGEFKLLVGLDLECFGVSWEQAKGLLAGKFDLDAPEKTSVVLGVSPLGEITFQGSLPWKGSCWSFVYRGGAFLLWRTPEKAE